MPSQLLTNDRISFVVAKPFTSRGKEYQTGDDFPQEEARDIEVFVRARFVIPVVDSIKDKKFVRQWHQEIRPKDEVLERLLGDRTQLVMPMPPDSEEVVNLNRLTNPNRPDPEPEENDGVEDTLGEAVAAQQEQAEAAAEAVHTETYDPSLHTVVEVNEYLASHPDERDDILAAERDGRGRKGILEA